MGAFLEKPKTEKYNESKSGAGLRYGLSSMQVAYKMLFVHFEPQLHQPTVVRALISRQGAPLP